MILKKIINYFSEGYKYYEGKQEERYKHHYLSNGFLAIIIMQTNDNKFYYTVGHTTKHEVEYEYYKPLKEEVQFLDIKKELVDMLKFIRRLADQARNYFENLFTKELNISQFNVKEIRPYYSFTENIFDDKINYIFRDANDNEWQIHKLSRLLMITFRVGKKINLFKKCKKSDINKFDLYPTTNGIQIWMKWEYDYGLFQPNYDVYSKFDTKKINHNFLNEFMQYTYNLLNII